MDDLEAFGQRYYSLDADKNVIPVTMDQWLANFGRHHRVAMTVKDKSAGRPYASTIFLGLSGAMDDLAGLPPRVFETMIIGGKHNGWQRRSPTWDAAIETHAIAVNLMEEPDQ